MKDMTQAIAEAEAIKKEMAEAGISIASLTREDAMTYYKQTLTAEGAETAVHLIKMLALLAIACNPTIAEAIISYNKMLDESHKQAKAFGAQTITSTFHDEKTHNADKLDVICKLAVKI